MLKLIRGDELRPQGRAIVYGAVFDSALKGLADRSYFEHPPIEVLASRPIEGVFHTLQSRDGVQKLGISTELIREGIAQTIPQMHALAETQGIRTISYLPSFTFQLPSSAESLLPLTPHEDVLFVGSYHNRMQLHQAVLAGSQLYHAWFSESLERTGELEQRVQHIPHTFQVHSVRDLSEEQVLVPYLVNRFVHPLACARERGHAQEAIGIQKELETFGVGTSLDEPLRALVLALTRPACRPHHVEEYQAAHFALIQYVADEAYEQAAVAREMIQAMRLR